MPRDWEQHYAQAENLDLTPSSLVVEAADLIAPGHALDLACGSGRNALYLARLGWNVVAVDSSPAAIRVLRARSDAAGSPIEARVVDLQAGAFPIEAGAYDLICDFFYLQCDLFPQIREGVRPGGLFAAQIHLRDDQPHRFVLEPGQLRRFMEGWTILHYDERVPAGHNRPSASILARRASPLSPQTRGGEATTNENVNRPRKHDREQCAAERKPLAARRLQSDGREQYDPDGKHVQLAGHGIQEPRGLLRIHEGARIRRERVLQVEFVRVFQEHDTDR